ncbi:hypothetical protein [Enterococcus sp. HY326]|uniref:hypothetical protein n=1 Tax=Enterococcus sp. HY326 TaxID=2971265 RepID=UPI00223F8691|nr:hypothetical protein [Enterococcus sp. HY326]
MSLLVDAVCPKCGYVNLELLDYCPNCGFQLRGTSGTNHPNAGISDEEIPENIINREEPIANSGQVIFAFPAGFGEMMAEPAEIEEVSNADIIQESVILPWKKQELAKENNNSSTAIAIEEMATSTEVDSNSLTEDFFEEDTSAASDDDGLAEEQTEATIKADTDLIDSEESVVEASEPETDEASASELVNITTEVDNSDEETQVEAAEDSAEMAIVADDVDEDDESTEANESEITEEISDEAVASTEETAADSSKEEPTDDSIEPVEAPNGLSEVLSGEAVVAEPEITAGTISRILEELAVIEALLQAEKEKLALTQQSSSSENTSLIAAESTTQQPAATKIEAMVEEYVGNESDEQALSSDEEDWIEEIEAASGGVHLAIVNNLLLNVMLMFVIAAGILALQYFILSHFTSELLLLSQQWGYLDVTWMLSISNGILLIILIVLIVPLVIALTSGIKDLIKFFKFSR